MAEPEMFDGCSAWFSTSVESHFKDKWRLGQGSEATLEEALFIFTQDSEAMDCKNIFCGVPYLGQHVAVFHPDYILACLEAGNPRHVAVGKFLMVPHAIKDRLISEAPDKWKKPRARNVKKSQKPDHPAIKKSKTCAAPEIQDDVLIYDLMKLPRAREELSDFVIGMKGCETFRCKKTK